MGFKCQNFDGDYACIDIDECSPEVSPCLQYQKYINRVGGFDCAVEDPCINTTCPTGHECFDTREISVDRISECRDIDECQNSPCLPEETCVNLIGSFKCKPTDYCATLPCDEGFICQNEPQSFSCVDIDECKSEKRCDIGFSCVNLKGSFRCDDNNECLKENICGKGYTCQNIIGHFTCVDIDECLRTVFDTKC